MRSFTYSGSAGVDQRIAVVMVESLTDALYIPMFQYMRMYRMKGFDDEDLHSALCQMTSALAALHRGGLIHRNIHIGCLRVRDGTSPSSSQRLQVLLTDYWFLQTPRKTHCQYSQGRGDWGCIETAAPEVVGSGVVTDKADMWALGMCVYYWATWGHYPDPLLLGKMRSEGVDAIRAKIPLCWGSWLSSMIFMCLQPQPSTRASAERVHAYLLKCNNSSKNKNNSRHGRSNSHVHPN
eukprot:gene6610-13386_t